MLEELPTEPTLRRRPPVVYAVEVREPEAPINMVGLHRIRQPLETKNPLVKLGLFWNYGVGLWNIGVIGCACAYPGVYPAVDFDSRFLQCGRQAPEGLCHRINRIRIGNA